MNFLHTFYPSLLRVPGFLVEFITPIVKARPTRGGGGGGGGGGRGAAAAAARAKVFYTMPEYEVRRSFFHLLLFHCVCCIPLTVIDGPAPSVGPQLLAGVFFSHSRRRPLPPFLPDMRKNTLTKQIQTKTTKTTNDRRGSTRSPRPAWPRAGTSSTTRAWARRRRPRPRSTSRAWTATGRSLCGTVRKKREGKNTRARRFEHARGGVVPFLRERERASPRGGVLPFPQRERESVAALAFVPPPPRGAAPRPPSPPTPRCRSSDALPPECQTTALTPC